MFSATANPPGRDAPLGRDETEWMIQEMGWIPSDFPNNEATGLMRIRFSEAVAAFSLQAAVQNVTQMRSAVPVHPVGAGPEPAQRLADVGVDSGVNPTEAEQDEVEVRSHSSTELIEPDTEGQEAAEEVPDETPGCAFFNLSPADPPSPDRCEEDTHRGPPSPDPEGNPIARDRDPARACACSPLLSRDRLPPFPRTAYSNTTRAWSFHAQPQ